MFFYSRFSVFFKQRNTRKHGISLPQSLPELERERFQTILLRVSYWPWCKNWYVKRYAKTGGFDIGDFNLSEISFAWWNFWRTRSGCPPSCKENSHWQCFRKRYDRCHCVTQSAWAWRIVRQNLPYPQGQVASWAWNWRNQAWTPQGSGCVHGSSRQFVLWRNQCYQFVEKRKYIQPYNQRNGRWVYAKAWGA